MIAATIIPIIKRLTIFSMVGLGWYFILGMDPPALRGTGGKVSSCGSVNFRTTEIEASEAF